jgi:hypothetical protein
MLADSNELLRALGSVGDKILWVRGGGVRCWRGLLVGGAGESISVGLSDKASTKDLTGSSILWLTMLIMVGLVDPDEEGSAALTGAWSAGAGDTFFLGIVSFGTCNSCTGCLTASFNSAGG